MGFDAVEVSIRISCGSLLVQVNTPFGKKALQSQRSLLYDLVCLLDYIVCPCGFAVAQKSITKWPVSSQSNHAGRGLQFHFRGIEYGSTVVID